MQPYQEASQEIRRQGEIPGKALKTIGSLVATAGSAYAGGSILGRVTPFLSKYIPEDLAIKGLSKIDPRFGKFIQKSLSSGKSFDEVKNFISGKAEEGAQQEQAKESRNIIEKESPELHQFIDQEVKRGRKPIEAGAIAQNDKRFTDVIKKLMKTHKTSWSNILQSIYGTGEMAQSGANPAQSGAIPQESKAALQQQAQPKTQGQGLDPALAQLLQEGNEILKRARGNRG